MNKTTKARKHTSAALQELLDEITPVEMEQTKNKMQLAARIEDLMRTQKWSKSKFAEKLGKNPSEITKWLSGTQNFTVDSLTEIAFALGVGLNELLNQPEQHVVGTIHLNLKAKAANNPITISTKKGTPNALFAPIYFTGQGEKTGYSQICYA